MCINKSTYLRCELITHRFKFAYICIYANMPLTCMTHHIFAYMNKLPLPIYLHFCKYFFFIYASILYLHIRINYLALHICIYNICSNMSLWHIHLYHIFAYFNKLTPQGEGRAGSGASFGRRAWGLTLSSRRPILPGVRRRGLEKGLRDSAVLSSLIPSWGLGEGGVDKFSWQVKVFQYSFFRRPYRCFSVTLNVILSLSDRYKIFTSD